MRNLLFILAFVSEVALATSFVDPVKIGASGPANSKAILDASSTTRGVLLPRMTTTQQNAITSPTEGLIIYDNVLHQLSNYNGTAWVSVGGGAGTISGPATSTVNNLALWNATDGTVLKNSSVAVSGSTITASLTGNVTGNLTGNADTVTTNANLTGDVTSVGNATTIGALKVTNGMLAGSIAASKLVGSDIATVGTITSGTWSGSSIALNKITAMATASIPYTDGSGFLTTTTAPAYDSTNKVITVTGDASAYKVVSATDSGASGKLAYDQTNTQVVLQATQSSTTAGSNLALSTNDIAGANANVTGQISLLTGSKTAGTGDSGPILLQTGTSAGGLRGTIKLVDGSEAAENGRVWTESNNAGGGHWITPTSGQNFVANPDAEINTAGWSTYADAAGALPVDCTAGSPSSTWTRTTSSPIGGAGAFLWTKSANNRQGEGASIPLIIDKASQAKVMNVEFDYQIASGTFVAGSSGVDSDLEAYVYDVTNAVVIQPSAYKLFSSATSPPSHFIANFQTASNSTSYRLCVHTATTSASAYTVQFKNFEVKRSHYTYGAPITDWVSYTPTFTGFGTAASVDVKWRRNGPDLEIKGKFTSGTSTAVAAQISLPAGLSIAANVETDSNLGVVWRGNTAANNEMSILGTAAGTTVFLGSLSTATVSPATHRNGNDIVSAADVIYLKFSVPITGWSSSVQMSDSAPQSAIAFVAASQTPTGTISGSDNVIKFGTVTRDDVGGYSTSTGLYTVVVPGWYQISSVVEYSFVASAANQVVRVKILKNGATAVASGAWTSSAAATANFSPTVSSQVYCNAGDTLGVYSFEGGTSATFTAAITGSALSISRVAGPVSIGATESIAAYYTGAPPTGTLAAAFNTTTFATKGDDSHSAYSAGTYTVPAPGRYSISAGVGVSATYALNKIADVAIFVNGVAITEGIQIAGGAVGTLFPSVHRQDVVLKAGDLVTIRSYCDATTPVFTATASANYFSIVRTGL